MSEADKQCSGCGRAKDRIGQDESRILEYVPAKLEVHVYVRPKYACRYCKDGVTSPPPPVRPIARGIAGPRTHRSDCCRQVRRPPAALSPRRLFHASRPAHPSQYAVRLGPGSGRAVTTAVRATERTRAAVARAVDRRYARDGAVFGTSREPSRPDSGRTLPTNIPTPSMTSRKVVPATDRRASCRDSRVTSTPMPTVATTRSIWGRTMRSSKWPAGDMRGKFFDAIHSSPREVHQLLEWIRQLYDVEERARELSARPRRSMRTAEPGARSPRHASRGAGTAGAAQECTRESRLLRRNQWQRSVATSMMVGCRSTTTSATDAVSPGDRRKKHWMFLGSARAGPTGGHLVPLILANAAPSDRTVGVPVRTRCASTTTILGSMVDAS